ncbi:MAG: TraR/DksA C4-type zinc finger protein [Bacillota bacterium]
MVNHNHNIYRKKLMQQKRELEARIKTIIDTGLENSMRESTGELSLYDNHPGDVGSELFERSKDLSLLDNNRIQLQKVEDALRKIDEGTYGTCDECGHPIPIERLNAIPETTKCLHCRDKKLETGDINIRPIEEKVLPASFKEKQEMDTEDTWQDVARWNEHAHGSAAGSYYGGTDLDEDRGVVQMVEGIPYFKGKDGVFYEDVYGHDDEGPPREKVIGEEEE